MAKDYYAILGVSKSSTEDDIKAAYRKMSKELHPDKHKGDKAAETKFKEVNQAYETLRDPEKRRAYDQFGEAGARGGFGGGGGGGGFQGFDFSNFSGGDASGFADLFGDLFGGGRGQARASTENGADHEVTVTLELRDVVADVEKTVRLKKLVTCSVCSGSGAEKGAKVITCTECSGTGQVVRTADSFFGRIQQRVICPKCRGSGKVPEKPCRHCSGEGRVQETVTVTVRIPAGIDHGQTLRVRGEGDSGRRGAQAGDLFVHVLVNDDARFQREGADIRSRVIIDVVSATLGTEIPVETLHGKVTLKIPEGTQPGSILRIKGKGLPVLSSSRHGDHYVTVEVEIPKKLSRKERELLEEWKKIQ